VRRLSKLKSCSECGLPMLGEFRRENWLERLYGEACDSIRGLCSI
jgi:hypothetical protein